MLLTEVFLSFEQLANVFDLPEGVSVVAVREVDGVATAIRVASEYYPAQGIANNGDPTKIGEAYAKGIEEKLAEPPFQKDEAGDE
jgi:hypothetical protein